ncbi:MAG: hypothetical protein ACYDA6_10190 [Solirubrobacteraceae bacterium]
MSDAALVARRRIVSTPLGSLVVSRDTGTSLNVVGQGVTRL